MLCIAVACRNKIYLKIGEFYMIGFIIGLLIGTFIGVALMCLCNAASDADKNIENQKTSEETKDDE